MKRDYPSDWDQRRRRVYKRDGYQCQNCGTGGGPKGNAELHAHHIVPLSQGGSNGETNLKTLCDQCHRAAHGRGHAPTGLGVDITEVPEPDEHVGMDFDTCECGSEDFSYETNTMVKCMDCDRVYELEEEYVTEAILEAFETCPSWFCGNTEFEYSPYHYEPIHPGGEDVGHTYTDKVVCDECETVFKADRKTGLTAVSKETGGLLAGILGA